MTTVYLAIEYNWKRVGGVFSTARNAARWIKRMEKHEPNLMWELHERIIDVPIDDDAALEDWQR